MDLARLIEVTAGFKAELSPKTLPRSGSSEDMFRIRRSSVDNARLPIAAVPAPTPPGAEPVASVYLGGSRPGAGGGKIDGGGAKLLSEDEDKVWWRFCLDTVPGGTAAAKGGEGSCSSW
jgi:hypothetical protein